MTQPLFRSLCWAVLALAWLSSPLHAASTEDASAQAQTLVHLLDYVAVDYPEFVRSGVVLDAAEYAEQREFASEIARRLETLEAPRELRDSAQTLLASIDAKAEGTSVATQALALRDDVIATFAVAAAPRRAPDLAAGAALYQQACAACHGATGHGDGVASAGLDPAPSDFHDAARMDQRSVFGLYNTISLGVTGTAMPAFRDLDDDARWALAFHVAGLRHDDETRAAGQVAHDAGGSGPISNLGDLVATDARTLTRAGIADASSRLAYLLSKPSALERNHEAHIAETQRLLREAAAAHARGEREAAVELAVAAYLQGFEPIESLLDTRAPALRVEIESQMQGLRAALRNDISAADLDAKLEAIDGSLAAADAALDGSSGDVRAIAASAFLILVREGLEAILVVAAVLALVVRSGRPEVARYIHIGWIGALVAGGLTWFAAHALIDISGATREISEGIAALLACVILLYVGFWLHGKAHAQAWNAFISRHFSGAMNGRTVWALAGVSFLAVYREAFETVLFYETLWAQGGDSAAQGLGLGFGAAVAVLLAIALAIFRYGLRLPLRPFFAVSAALMASLAVVFAGQGVAALQEAGVINADPIAFPRLEWLGVFPTMQTVGMQLIALVVVALIFLLPRWRKAPA